MTPFVVQGIDHIAVSAPSELERQMLDWYSTTLGLKAVPKPQGTRGAGGWFRAGDSELHVTIDEGASPGPGHFGLIVDDFQAAVSQLQRAGCTLEEARTIPGRRRCYTHDPAGNTIEIMSYGVSPSA